MKLTGQDLVCVRGGRSVFSALNFSCAGQTALAITGRNGAGKSSLLRLIAGLLPYEGQLALDGGAAELTLPEQAHYLGHHDALKPPLTVRENLGFWAEYLGSNASGVESALAAVGLGHAIDLPAAYLSAGQRRRLSLARLLAVKRPLWLLDEPAASLDSDGRAMLATLMRDHLSGGGIVVAATHEPLGIEAQELRIGGAE